jgi:hypothetical protein
MFSSLRIAAVGASAALVFSVLASAASAQATFSNQEGAIHFMLTPSYAQKIGRVPNRDTGEMEYFAGPVFSQVEVVSVMWGKNVNSQTVAGMPGFLAAMPNSTFMDMLGEYSTKGVKGQNGHAGHQTIVRGSLLGQYVITPQIKRTLIHDQAIHRELLHQISQGSLPANSPNVLYMIYFPSTVTIEAFGLRSCSNFGAYHFASMKHAKSTNIYYAVMPDCGYSFDSHTIVSAHEFSEATTDNIPTPGTNPAYPQAWNNAAGYEIGDLCQGTQGQLTTNSTTYYVQQEYLNSTAACSTGNYTSP